MSPLLQQLIDALKCLPGVGPKSAQRMAFYLLERDTDGAKNLSAALTEAVEKIDHCSMCRTLSENELCEICASNSRDNGTLCVIETPADVFAIEHTAEFRGKYFVLMGHLSPLDGIGPAELGLDLLDARLAGGEVGITVIRVASFHHLRGDRQADVEATTLGTGEGEPDAPFRVPTITRRTEVYAEVPRRHRLPR